MSYRFHIIDSSSNTRQVYPLEFSKASLERKRDLAAGQIFYRTWLKGKLVFYNDIKNGIDDFDFFRQLEMSESGRCSRLILTIEMLCGSDWEELWKGQFSTGIGDFDLDRCLFSVTPEPYDRYTCILSELEKKINILKYEEVVSTNTFILPEFEFYICRYPYQDDFAESACQANLPAPTGTWKIFQRSSAYPLDMTNSSGEGVTIYFRERIITSCIAGTPQPPPSGSGWQLLLDDCSGSNTSVWVRFPEFTPPREFTGVSQSVQAGLCTGSYGTIEEIPPPQLRLDVSLDNKSVFTPELWGWTQIRGSGDYVYKMLNVPAYASAAWNTAPLVGGWIIVSGSGTHEVVIRYSNPINAVLRGGITFPDSTLSQYGLLPLGSNPSYGLLPSASPYIKLLGLKYLCKGQRACRYDAPPLPTNLPFGYSVSTVWIVPQGATVTSGGGASDSFVEFDLDPNFEGSTTVQCNMTVFGGGGMTKNYATIQVNVSAHPYTGNEATPINPHLGIIGANYAEAGSQPNKYKVYYRDGSNYTWEVIGGTILSGQSTNEIEVEWGAGTDGIVYVKETIIDCGCTWYRIIPCGDNGEPPYYWCNAGEVITYDKNRWLLGAVEYMFRNSGCNDGSADVVSDFFEWKAVGDTSGFAVGVNYVTGITNQINYLTIAAKSDVIFPNASNPATRADWTLKEAFTALREMFHAWWFIDDAGRLRIEHITWFIFPVSLDLTLFAPYLKGLNKYSHDKSDIAKFERYRFMEAINTDFVGTDIWYDSICANQNDGENVIEHIAPRITTDLSYIYTSPSDISRDGFVIMANFNNGAGFSVITDIGVLSGAALPNAPLSWAKLHDAFHKYWRLLSEGYMNNQLTVFPQPKPKIKAVAVEVPFCCEFISYDPKFRIRSPLGEILGRLGYLESATFAANKKTVVFQINYPS